MAAERATSVVWLTIANTADSNVCSCADLARRQPPTCVTHHLRHVAIIAAHAACAGQTKHIFSQTQWCEVPAVLGQIRSCLMRRECLGADSNPWLKLPTMQQVIPIPSPSPQLMYGTAVLSWCLLPAMCCCCCMPPVFTPRPSLTAHQMMPPTTRPLGPIATAVS